MKRNKLKILSLIIFTLLLIPTIKADAFTLTQKLGTRSMNISVEKNEKVTMRFVNRIGLQFKNWIVESGGLTINGTENPLTFYMPENNVTIRGDYYDKYIVTFNNNGGTGSIANLEIAAGGNENLPQNTTITKEGYTFKGWSTEIDETVEYQDAESITPTEDITLYAVWEVSCEHIYETQYDSTNHWEECTLCGEKEDAYGHNYKWTDNCATCNYDYGEYKCDCGNVNNSQEHSSHSHNYVGATCTEGGICCCGNVGEPNGHTEPSTYQKDSTNHWKVCSVCNSTINKVNHTYSGNTCSACGYQKEILPIANVPVGAYIEYTPTASKATISNTYTGANSGSGSQTLTITKTGTNKIQWKVYKNNSGQLDIISAESVGNLTLSGATGYANAVYVLNTLCSQYVNTTYATGAVSIGSTKEWITGPTTKANITSLGKTMSVGILDTSSSGYPITHAATKNLSTDKAKYPYLDSHYTDTMPLDASGYLVESLRHTNTTGEYEDNFVWLASRGLQTNSALSNFNVRYFHVNGWDSDDILYNSFSDGNTDSHSYSYGVRPVVFLKSGLRIVDGNGTSASPYIISL